MVFGKNVTFELWAISTGGFPGDRFWATFKQMMFCVGSSSLDYIDREDFFSFAMDPLLSLIKHCSLLSCASKNPANSLRGHFSTEFFAYSITTITRSQSHFSSHFSAADF